MKFEYMKMQKYYQIILFTTKVTTHMHANNDYSMHKKGLEYRLKTN